MNHLDISCCWSIVIISSIRRVWIRAINNILPQISPFDQVGYLFLQLETILSVMPMVLVKLTILILVSLEGVGLDFPWPFYEFFIFHLHEYLDDMSIKGR